MQRNSATPQLALVDILYPGAGYPSDKMAYLEDDSRFTGLA